MSTSGSPKGRLTRRRFVGLVAAFVVTVLYTVTFMRGEIPAGVRKAWKPFLLVGVIGAARAGTANQPANFQIWGTSTSTTSDQRIDIKGNGVLSGVVYAPNGDVGIVGNGDVMGSMVAERIRVTGNATFHYDESLANFGSGNPYRVSRWRELTTATDRAAVSSVLSLGW